MVGSTGWRKSSSRSDRSKLSEPSGSVEGIAIRDRSVHLEPFQNRSVVRLVGSGNQAGNCPIMISARGISGDNDGVTARFFT